MESFFFREQRCDGWRQNRDGGRHDGRDKKIEGYHGERREGGLERTSREEAADLSYGHKRTKLTPLQRIEKRSRIS